jgi:hypothetical protein
MTAIKLARKTPSMIQNMCERLVSKGDTETETPTANSTAISPTLPEKDTKMPAVKSSVPSTTPSTPEHEEILSSPTTYHFQCTPTHRASPHYSRIHAVQYATPDDTTLKTITSTRLISTVIIKPFAGLQNGRSRGGVKTLISPESSILQSR